MKSLVFASLFMAVSAMASNYKVDVATSSIAWKGQKVLVKSTHEGTMKLSSGSLEYVGGELKSGSFEIDMNSINNTDLKDAEKKGQLEGHLKSPDFFDVTKFKTAKYVIKSAKKVKAGEFKLTGDLTIKDVTKSHEITVMLTENAKGIVAKASTSFDRAVYNVKYNSGKFMDPVALGDKIIDDKISLDITLNANK